MALKLEPQNAVAYNNRGLAYETTGNFALAIKDYDIAIKLNWDFYWVTYIIIVVLVIKK